VGDLHAGHDLEPFHRQVVDVADAERRVVELVGLPLRERDQLPHRFHRHGRIAEQQHGIFQHEADRREIGKRIERHVLVKVRQDRERSRTAP
jgi:hypothetical protein